METNLWCYNESGKETLLFQEWSDTKYVYVPGWIYTALGVFMAIITCISLTFNGIVIATFCKYKKLRQPMNLILLNLTVADFVGGLVGGVMATISNSLGYFFAGKIGCATYVYLIGTLGIGSLFSIVLLSLSRYIHVCKPNGYKFNQMHAKKGIAITWTLSFLWNLPPLFWGGYEIDGIGTSCGLAWHAYNQTSMIFLGLFVTFCFVIPLAVMLFSYAAILYTVKKQSNNSTLNVTVTSKSEKKVTKMTVAIMVAFLVTWSPYAAMGLYRLFVSDIQLHPFITTFPAYVAKSGTIYDPFIYIIMNKQLKNGVTEFLGDHRWKLCSNETKNVRGHEQCEYKESKSSTV